MVGYRGWQEEDTLEILGVALDPEISRRLGFQRFGDFQSSNAWASVLATTDGFYFSLCPRFEGPVLPS
jgi:hypothetical protein